MRDMIALTTRMCSALQAMANEGLELPPVWCECRRHGAPALDSCRVVRTVLHLTRRTVTMTVERASDGRIAHVPCERLQVRADVATLLLDHPSALDFDRRCDDDAKAREASCQSAVMRFHRQSVTSADPHRGRRSGWLGSPVGRGYGGARR